ncbi:MAG: glycosyltransferase [Rhodospirillaceae bacterium]|nr:glycosyltransferase [Rhodospirillaceae bacterium]
MHIVFLNPQGNFDPADSHLTEHPDFGGQLVYVKEVAQAMTAAGHRIDILTRQILDKDWPEFAEPFDHYPETGDDLRIIRVPCGGPGFLSKERLWDCLPEFVANTIAFYSSSPPDFATAHYADGGYCAALLERSVGTGFTFTGHSLGAQKLEKLGVSQANAAAMEARFRFSRRIAAERLAMTRAVRIITSTEQERREQYAHPLYAGAIDVDDDARFSVIPPGVNTEIFSAKADDADAPPDGELPQGIVSAERPMVVVSNRLDTKKNTIGVVEAFAASADLRARADMLLCLRGIDDPFESMAQLNDDEQSVLQPILKTIDRNGLRDHVRFLNIPSQRALAATYRAVAAGGGVFALTAFYEPFGLGPIEAAACGLACVVTRNGGPSEIFADGSGILVDPADPSDIARGLNEALLRQREFAARAHARVVSTYTWRETATRYAALIDQALRTQRRSAEDVPALDASDIIHDYLTR